MADRTYVQDAALLAKHSEVIELSCGSTGKFIVAPAYQGRVMTSTIDGQCSFGWVNYEFVAAGKDDPHFNNYGGEDRLWLGPEAGRYGLWFHRGQAMELKNWRTPEPLSRGPFQVVSQGQQSVTMERTFSLSNYAGTRFDCRIERTVRALGREAIARLLKADVPAGVACVGFESDNKLSNAGQKPWTAKSGLLSIWSLGQFNAGQRGWVILPIRPGSREALGPRATTNYFGDVPSFRCRVGEDHLLLRCDGQYRSKVGISPGRARDVMGSYDVDAKVLTIVQYSLPADAAERPYVNSLWTMDVDPYAGDAINAYNDGSSAPGAEQMGQFYELETSSPAAALEPGQTASHVHRTSHFVGPEPLLAGLCRAVLGIDLPRPE